MALGAVSVPPVVLMSAASKPNGFSEKVKVILAFWPALRKLAFDEMASVGERVSKVSEGVLL